MAVVRKSAQQVAARELARERASVQLAQQERLIDLAVDFNLEHDEIASASVRKLERLQAIEDEYRTELEQRSTRLGRIVAQMAEQGEKPSGIATRLGQKLADVKRWMALNSTGSKTADTEAVEGEESPAPVRHEGSDNDNQEQLVA